MKKLIAIVLTLAMMVSCLVFTASAETASGVEVSLEGPATVEKDSDFTVMVRVTDTADLIVGGVQGSVVVTGADLKSVEVNTGDLFSWNKTQDVNTLYKTDGNTFTFASLNNLTDTSNLTRGWYRLTYTATATDTITLAFKDVKVSDKSANLITDATVTGLTVGVVDTSSDPYIKLTKSSILATEEAIDANKQALVLTAKVNIPDDAKIVEVGAVFYPNALLNGATLTVDTEGAVIARVTTATADRFNEIKAAGSFDALLRFGFDSTTDDALRFLGTKVASRVYYKTEDGTVVYASNNVDNYIVDGVSKKAAMNSILNYGNTLEASSSTVTVDAYNTAKASLKTTVDGWAANRATVLRFAVENAIASAATISES